MYTFLLPPVPTFPASEFNQRYSYIYLFEYDSNSILVLPELYSTTYNARDLKNLSWFIREASILQQKIIDSGINIIFGGILPASNNKFYNVAFTKINGQITTFYKKYLPTYSEFEETRYFISGNYIPHDIGNKTTVAICEDIWKEDTWLQIKNANIKNVIAINASPYYIGKISEKINLLRRYAIKYQINLIYQNWFGGFDELTFIDRFVITKQGIVYFPVDMQRSTIRVTINDNGEIVYIKNAEPYISAELIEPQPEFVIALNLKSYVRKAIHEEKVIIGVSGGIDSATVLAIVRTYLPNFIIHAYFLPSKHTSKDSFKAIELLRSKFDVDIKEIPIDEWTNIMKTSCDMNNIAYQNLQARLRGMFLMCQSNNGKGLVLACGNKTEYSIGYATLYGDMAGGYAPIKDLWKTQVYEVAKRLEVPQFIIDRKPSAELSDNQYDEYDIGFDYEILDYVLQQYLETGIMPDGKLAEIIKRFHKMEFKRRQSPIGPKLQKWSFERDWKFPIQF